MFEGLNRRIRCGADILISFCFLYGYVACHGLCADDSERKSTHTKCRRVLLAAQSSRKGGRSSTRILEAHPFTLGGATLVDIRMQKHHARGIAFLEAAAKCDVIRTSEETHLQLRMLTCRLALIAAVASGGAFSAGVSVAQELPPGDGRDTVQRACTACHGVDLIVSQRHTSDEWSDVVSRMVGNGASLTDDQFAAVVKYLSIAFAPDGAASNTVEHSTIAAH